MNSIFCIKPYLSDGQWMFDDPERGLVREPFVGGADLQIDRAVAGIPDAERGFLCLFAAQPFPGATIRLDWVRAEGTGNVYRWPETGLDGWFCPALRAFFIDAAPQHIHVQVKPARAAA